MPKIDETTEENSIVVQNIDKIASSISVDHDEGVNAADRSEAVSVLSSEYNPSSVVSKKSIKKGKKLNQREQDAIDKAKARETFTYVL